MAGNRPAAQVVIVHWCGFSVGVGKMSDFDASQLLYRRAWALTLHAARADRDSGLRGGDAERDARAFDARLEAVILLQASLESWIFRQARRHLPKAPDSWLTAWNSIGRMAGGLGRDQKSISKESKGLLEDVRVLRNYLVHGDEAAEEKFTAHFQGKGIHDVLSRAFVTSLMTRAEVLWGEASECLGEPTPFQDGAWIAFDEVRPGRSEAAAKPLPAHEDRLLVAICTKDRPTELARCIDSVVGQDYGGAWEVAVIDNSSDGSARGVVEVRRGSAIPVRWYPSPEGGLASARNVALELAMDYAAVVFIDDDEMAQPGWLAAFAEASERWPDDVLAGPVIPRTEVAPDWDPQLRRFTRATYPQGAVVGMVGDGNVLVPRRLYSELGLKYATWLDGHYGQDGEFFLRWRDVGGVIRWVRGAKVVEHILSSRLDVRYPHWRATRGAEATVLVASSRGEFNAPLARHLVARARKFSGSCLIAFGSLAGKPVVQARGWGLRGMGVGHLRGLESAKTRPWMPESRGSGYE